METKTIKDFYSRAYELATTCKRVKNNKVYSILALEYNIGLRNASDRFKSFFGKNIRDFVSDYNTPNKETLRDAVILCETQEELLQFLNINYDWITGLYDKYFNVSTFRKTKLKLYNEFDIIPYNPSIEDNLSILISQHLGDGCFEFNDNRSCLKIEHGFKQFEYLKFKINLIKKAFPTVAGLETIRKRVYKDYISYVWRSNNIRDRYIDIIKEESKEVLIKKLTPFGWLLWYLDDGCLFINKTTSSLFIACSDDNISNSAIKELETYGFYFNKAQNGFLLSNRLEIIKFLNCFVKPYIHLIPKCMEYKCFIKI